MTTIDETSTPVLVNDPRMPNKILQYRHREKVEDPSGDVWALFSMVAGMLGLWMRWKLSAWVAVFLCLASIANASNPDLKQIIVSSTLSVMSLVLNYFGPTMPVKPS